MRLGILVIGASLLLGTTGASMAAVNCKQVNKYLQTGRSVKDIAETMVIGEDEVKKCQDEAASAPKAGEAKPGEQGGAAGQGMQK